MSQRLEVLSRKFQKRLDSGFLPLQPVSVRDDRYYWIKRNSAYIVDALVQRDNKKRHLRFTSTKDEAWASKCSLEMSKMINNEIARRK